jgi:hypothetical protein
MTSAVDEVTGTLDIAVAKTVGRLSFVIPVYRSAESLAELPGPAQKSTSTGCV